MVPNEDKEKFLKQLEEMPIVSIICKRVGISKASIYRWLAEDSAFKKRYALALKRGRSTLVDHAESKLVKLVDKENLGAIRMVLEANSKRYYKPRKAMSAPREHRVITTMKVQVVNADGTYQDEQGVHHKWVDKNTPQSPSKPPPPTVHLKNPPRIIQKLPPNPSP